MAVRNIIFEKIHPEIRKKGNINHTILYALNLFGPMKRAEFISDPGKSNRINKNTFHDHIRELKTKGYIDKYYENREAYYELTHLGEDQLSRILVDYELDFNTLLEIGERKSRNLIKRLGKFFETYKIEDKDIKIEYIELANLISLDEKLKEWYTEDQFNKLLLFLVLNHPKFYPSLSISIESFREKYNRLSINKLSKAQIEFFIEQVIDENRYNINFHKLALDLDDFVLFFRDKSEYGKYFENTIDTTLRNLVHFKNLHNTKVDIEDLELSYREIITTLIDRFNLFHPDLRKPLYILIDQYRRKVKDEIIRRSINEIPEYSGFILLPEKPIEPKFNLTASTDRRTSNYYKGKTESLESDEPTSITRDFKLIKSSFKDIQYFYKENILNRAWELYEQKDFNGTLKQIDKMIKIEDNPELYYWKAEILAIDSPLKKYEEALEIIQKGINLNPMPGNYNFYRLRAEILKRTKNYEEALDAINKAISIDSQPRILNDKFYLLLDSKRFNEAIEFALRYSICSEKELIERFRSYSDYYFTKLESFGFALDLVEKAIELDSKDERNYILKANILSSIGDFNGALNEIERAIELNPSDGNYHYKAEFLEKLGNYEGALNAIQFAIELNPHISFYYIDKGYILKSMNKINDALKNIDKIIELYGFSINIFHPFKSPYYSSEKTYKDVFYFIDLLIELERYDEALKIIEKTLDSEDDYYKTIAPIYSHLYKAKILKILKNYPQALQILDDAIEKTDDIELYALKTDILVEIEDYENALEAINKALSFPSKYRVQFGNFINKKIDILISMKRYQEIIKLIRTSQRPESITYAAINLIDSKQYSLAREVIKIGYERDPEENSEFRFNLYTTYYNRLYTKISENEFENALKIIDNFLKFDDKDPEIFEYKISSLLGLKKYDDALVVADKAISQWSKYPTTLPIQWDLIGEDEEIKLTKEEKKKKSHGYKFYILKAKILLRAGRYNDSLSIIDKIIKLNPNLSLAYQIKSLDEWNLEQHDNALKSINRAIELDPNDLTSNQINTNLLYELDRYAEALTAINQCFSINQKSPINFSLKAKILFFLSKFDEALEVLNKGIERFPDYQAFYNNRGLILDSKGNKIEALEDMKKAVELGEASQGTYYNMAQILFSLEKYEEALDTIDKAIDLSPADILSHQERSAILANLKRYDEALEEQEFVMELDPGLIKTVAPEHQVYTTMAYSFARDGKKKKAINSIKKAIEIDPEESEYYYYYGEILMIFEEYDEAIKQFEKAKELHFTPIETFIDLGECFMILGNYDKALENLKIGRNLAAHSVKERVRTDKGYEIRPLPQTNLIERAENYIAKFFKVAPTLKTEDLFGIGSKLVEKGVYDTAKEIFQTVKDLAIERKEDEWIKKAEFEIKRYLTFVEDYKRDLMKD